MTTEEMTLVIEQHRRELDRQYAELATLRENVADSPTVSVPRELSDGDLWSFLRSAMAQGADIHQDYASGTHPTYEHYARRLDMAASERVDTLRGLLAVKKDGA